MSVIAPSTFDFLAVNDDLAGIAHIAYFALSNELDRLDFWISARPTHKNTLAGAEVSHPSPLNIAAPRACIAPFQASLLR